MTLHSITKLSRLGLAGMLVLLFLGGIAHPALADPALSRPAAVPASGPLLAFSCASVTEIPQAECEALAALYSATNGANWTNHTGWLETSTPCSWYGVVCYSGSVQQVKLVNNNLSGPIPAELANLPQLQMLHLQYNHLTGSIPPALENLKHLMELSLTANKLDGTIPAGLGSLPLLYKLYVNANMLEGEIPSTLLNLQGRAEVNVNYNRLYTTNQDMVGFLNVQLDTQTVPPAGVTARALNSTTAEVYWKPITYQGDLGGYQIETAADPAGPYQSIGLTALWGKATKSYVARELEKGKTYYFCVRTITYAHGGEFLPDKNQQNDLLSACSAPVKLEMPVPHPVYLPLVRGK